MSLINFIEKIQKKPRYVRVQILWFSVIVFMFLIVSFWIVSLRQTLPKTAETKEELVEEPKENTPTLGETLKASIGGFFKKGGLEEVLKSEIEKKEGQMESEKDSDQKSGSRPEGVGKEIKPAKLPLGS